MENEEISFGRFRLHLGRRELRRDEVLVRLHRRALDILCALAAAKAEVVGKDELMARLWPGRIVEEGNIHVHVSALRRALDEHGGGHSYIVTVPGRGYRLAGLVDAFGVAPSTTQILPLPDKPSIAVLPFANLSGDPEQEYFADGMVEEIITALSRIRWLFVIARNSTFSYKGQAIDVKQVGRELGVRYVLEGSVRKAGGRMRITAQLIDARNGVHLWADRFDGSPEDVFDLQDQVAESVAGVIEPTLRAAEIHRSSERRTSDLTAYDLYLRALQLRSTPHHEFVPAFDLVARALERDPHYGPALALTAYFHYRMDVHRWTQDRETTRSHALDFARRALRYDPNNPAVLSHVAFVLGYFGEDIDTVIALADRALELNPSYADGWYYSGVLRNWAGHPELALKRFAKYLRLNPRDRYYFNYLIAVNMSLFFCQRFDEAAVKLRECLERWPDHTLSCRFLAASYAHLGRFAEARDIVQRLGPAISDDGLRYRSPEHRELYLSGLRLAMGESAEPEPPPTADEPPVDGLAAGAPLGLPLIAD